MDITSELAQPYAVSDEQVETFHEKSWVKLPNLLDRETATQIYRSIKSFETVAPSADEKWMTEPDYQKLLVMHDGMAWKDDFFRDVAVSRRLAGTALHLTRAESASFFLDMSFIKPGDHGGETPFHQDFPHWPFDRKGALTIWVALTDMTAEMGTLRFLEGSHREGPLGRYSRQAGDDLRKDYPELEVLYPIAAGEALSAGDATAHWDMTIHGANSNTTQQERAAYTVRYLPRGTRYTGSSHRHFDKFALTANDRFDEMDAFPLVRSD